MEPDISKVASLIGEPARAKMLMALMSGKALTATELATEAEVTPQTASSHLKKMINGELLVLRKQGRHRYFRLHSLGIAEVIERLLLVSSPSLMSQVTTGPDDHSLRTARVCYDHLAGSIAVSLYDSLCHAGHIVEENYNAILSQNGRAFFRGRGVNFDILENGKRPICRSCLDWSERRDHLAGALGQWILNDIITRKWAARDLNTRAVHFTQQGLTQLRQSYQIKV